MAIKKSNESIEFQASSPDEKALVIGATKLGASFHKRDPKMVAIDFVCKII